MKFIVGIPSFNRPRILRLALSRLLLHRKRMVGVVVVADADNRQYLDQYKEVLEKYRDELNMVYEVYYGRRGSAKARNRILDIVEEIAANSDYTLIMYDDDYLCPASDWLTPVKKWLKSKNIGVVGGKVINLRRRSIDPDFTLDLVPALADVLTRLTGFIFLDTKHGPRYVDYTTPLMAIKVDVIKKGVRYDPEYRGTGYREESDFQQQIRSLGYKIVFEPNFYVYHLNIDVGGNRTINTAPQRFYWKTRNNVYFIKKHGMGLHKLVTSTTIIVAYSIVYGMETLKASLKAFKDAVKIAPIKPVSAPSPSHAHANNTSFSHR